MSINILTQPAPSADMRMAYGDGEHHFGELRLPGGGAPHPIVIVIHGGYWRAQYGFDYMGHVCESLREAGLATWNIEYRRIGHDGGGYPGTLLDVARAADHVRALSPHYDLDLTRVVTLGHSAGGHLACWLAGRHRIMQSDPLHDKDPLPITGVVSLAGVLDLRRGWQMRLSNNVIESLLGGAPADVPTRYDAASPYELLPLGVPQVLIQGTADANVPFEISQRYYDAARAKGDRAELIALDGAGHFEVVDPQTREWQVILDATKRMAQRE